MSALAYVANNDEPLPRVSAKRLPQLRLVRGGLPPARFPPGLEVRPGAGELYARLSEQAQDLIAETCRKIPELFGPGTRFALEDVTDVGDETVEHMLYLVIATTLDAEEAWQAYERFQEDWWLDNVDRGQGDVHIGLELL